MTTSPTTDIQPDYVMVPREPTEAMLEALARQAQRPTGWHNVYPAMYRALLAAAPASPIPTSVANEGVREDDSGWIIGSADGKRWRHWYNGAIEWVDNAEEATRYARRHDAEAVHREDEEAWRVVRYAALSPALDNTAVEGQARTLRQIYDVLHAIHDDCEDEGDRIYLGSTNDRHTLARQLRRLEKLIPTPLLYQVEAKA